MTRKYCVYVTKPDLGALVHIQHEKGVFNSSNWHNDIHSTYVWILMYVVFSTSHKYFLCGIIHIPSNFLAENGMMDIISFDTSDLWRSHHYQPLI